MGALEDGLIREITARILRITNPRKIILFGSAATGSMTADSDIDLLVLEDRPENTRQESISLRNQLRGLGYPFDIVVMPTEKFEETKQWLGGLAYPADKEGKVIYEAA